MLSSFFSLFLSLIKWVLILISPIFLIIGVLFLILISYHTYYYSKGMRMKKNDNPKYKKRSFIHRIFIDFPKRLSLDLYNRDPNEFKEYGLHMFCGEQGSGKTVSVVETLLRMKKIYPKCKIRTNMSYQHEDAPFNHWKQLVNNDNGIYGQIEVIDEIQSWFSSMQSKDFPVEMLGEISQQRKQRKMLVGTAQVFSRIGKPIREQTAFVYLPLTVLGCLTIVRVSKPRYFDDEKQVFKRYIKTYFFVHTDEIRNAFDTYKKIQNYKKQGFQKNTVLQLREN